MSWLFQEAPSLDPSSSLITANIGRQSPSLPKRMRGRAGSSKLLITAWSFWGPLTKAIQEDTTSPSIRMKDAPVTQEITRNLGAMSGTWVQDQIKLEQKVLLARKN